MSFQRLQCHHLQQKHVGVFLLVSRKIEETKRQPCIPFSSDFEAWDMLLCGRVNASKTAVHCKPIIYTVKWCTRCTSFTLVADFGGHGIFTARSRSPPSGSCCFVSFTFIRSSFVSLRLRLRSTIYVFWCNNMSQSQQASRHDHFINITIGCPNKGWYVQKKSHCNTQSCVKDISVHPNPMYFHIEMFASKIWCSVQLSQCQHYCFDKSICGVNTSALWVCS